MLWTFSLSRPVPSGQLFISLRSIICHSSTSSISEKLNEDVDHHDRLATTKKICLLGLQINQARKALSIYHNYVYQQKKLPDLRMFAIAINCAMIAEDLMKGREIHQFIERDLLHLKDNLMLKQQLRYMYIKCNDQLSTDKLFQQSSSIEHTQTQKDQNLMPLDSNQLDKIKIK